MLNLKSLQSFRAIMQTGSATAAAKQMGLTQPGISRLLASLEQSVGYALFYREHSRLIPTDEALRLRAEIELLLNNADRFLALARNLRKFDAGSLTIVAPASFSSGPLADAVASFMAGHPAVSISIDSQSPQQARELVAQRSIDCGFTQLPEQHPGLICYPILKSALVCAVPSLHPLAQQANIQLAQLCSEPLVLLGKGRPSRQNLEQLFQSEGIKPQVKIETHNIATACAYVKRQQGIAIINKILAEQYVDKDMRLIPLTNTISHEYGFIHSAHAPMSRLVKAFYQHCLNFFNTESNEAN